MLIHVVVLFGSEDPLCELCSTEKAAKTAALRMARQMYPKRMQGFRLDESSLIENILHEINCRVDPPGMYYFWEEVKG